MNSSYVRSKIVNSIFLTKDFFLSNLPKLDKLRLSFTSKKELILENKYLREKVELNNLFKLKSQKLAIENYILVKVIADVQSDYNKTIIINAGKNMNINKGNTALTNKGLIGSVIETYDRYSRVLLINDINSKIPVRVGSNNVKAIISGNNTNKMDLLYLKENVSFDDGDIVYTSGDGGYFNSGIPIGILKKNNNTIHIEPFNNMSEHQYINVFINQFKNF